MKNILCSILFLVSSLAHGAFEKLTVTNLDFEYQLPYGKGTVDRVGIGLGLAPKTYGIEVNRTEDAFELTSPYLDFTWRNPLPFIYDIEEMKAVKTSAGLGTRVHHVEAQYFMVRPRERGEYVAHEMKGVCEGSTRGSFQRRLLEDCVTKLDLTIKRIDVPEDFILYRVARELPLTSVIEEVPADHVVAKVQSGELYLQFYIKYIFYAGLRTWGHVQLEDNNETLAIRVDQIKFGYLPVTGMVMKKLKELIKNPDVKVDPPWIRVKLGKL